MPTSVGIAAFVVGLGLLIAAIVGQKVKLISLELPDLSRFQRLTVGALGVGLTIFGLTETRGERARLTASTAVAAPATVAGIVPATATTIGGATNPGVTLTTSASGPPPTTGTSPAPSQAPPANIDLLLPCLTNVAPGDVFTLDLERGRRTDRKPQAGMPRDALVAVVPRVDGKPLGVIVYRTRQAGATFGIEAMYDTSCARLSTYTNRSNPDAAVGVVGTYETVTFSFGSTAVGIMLAYGEGDPVLLMTGQVM